MDASNQTADKLHRVKRAYTRKPVSTKEANVRMEGADAVETVALCAMPVVVVSDATAAQAYANRVWGGQSVDVPPAERRERVRNALRGQNLPIEGVVLDGVSL